MNPEQAKPIATDLVLVPSQDLGLAEFERTHERILKGLREYVSRMPIAYMLAGDLRHMRDDRLYLHVVRDNGKPKLKTFADYVQYLNRDLKVLNFEHRATAYKVFKETDVLVRLSDSTSELPLSRSIFAELAKLQPDHQAIVWLDVVKTTPPTKARPSDVQASAVKLYGYQFPEAAKSQSEILADLRERAPTITSLIAGHELILRWNEFLAILNPPKRQQRRSTAPVTTAGHTVSLDGDVAGHQSPEGLANEIADVSVPECPATMTGDAPQPTRSQSVLAESTVNPAGAESSSQSARHELNDIAPEHERATSSELASRSSQSVTPIVEDTFAAALRPDNERVTTTPTEPPSTQDTPASPTKRQVTARAEVDGAYAVIGFSSRDDYLEVKAHVDLWKLGFRFVQLKWRRDCDEADAAAALVADVTAKLRDAGVAVKTAA